MSFLTRRRQTAVECFFCLSSSVLSPNQDAQHWRCERCGCVNARDAQGRIKSVDPAMRDPALNTRSFALRAAPSTSRIPSSTASSPFCQCCLTNQTLITNLLANYLPDDLDPSYPQLYANLDNYMTNLHARYPPVCAQCQPAVDEALKRSDYRAQAGAWAGMLKRSEARQADRHVDEGTRQDTVGQVSLWLTRGVLSCISCIASAGVGATAVFTPERLQRMDKTLGVAYLVFNALSICWIAWDPYWLRRIRSGGRVKVIGRAAWVRDMMAILAIRLASSSAMLLDKAWHIQAVRVMALLELLVFVHAFLSLRVKHPLPVRLIRSKPDLRQPPTPQQPSFQPPALSSLSLSNQPSPTHHNPIFGQHTIPQPLPQPAPVSEAEPMEWEPDPSAVLANGGWTGPGAPTPEKPSWDSFGAGRQRMFPKTEESAETGLESLLEGWGIGGGGTSSAVEAPGLGSAFTHATVTEDRLMARCWTALTAFRTVAIAVPLLPAVAVPPILQDRDLSPYIGALEGGLAVVGIVYLALSPPSVSHNRGKRVVGFSASVSAYLVHFLPITPIHRIASFLPLITDIVQYLAWQ